MFKNVMVAAVALVMLNSCAPAHVKSILSPANANASMTSRVPIVMESGMYWVEPESGMSSASVTGEYYFKIEDDGGPTILRPVYIRPPEEK